MTSSGQENSIIPPWNTKSLICVAFAIAGLAVLFSLWAFRPIGPVHDAGDQSPATEHHTDAPISLDTVPVTNQAIARAMSIQSHVAADPTTWPTEDFSQFATKELKRLLNSSALGKVQLSAVDDKCLTQPLRPQLLTTVLETKLITVKRLLKSDVQFTNDVDGRLAELSAGIVDGNHIHPKIVSVSQIEDGFETRVHVEGGGNTIDGQRSWTAIWECSWRYDDATPKLLRIEVAEYEEVQSARDSWLVDSTKAILGNADGYTDQLLYGMDYWVNKLEHRLFPNRLGHHGLAIADVNNDGLEDLFVCQAGGLPNRLFIHGRDGTAIEMAEASGVAILDDTTAALFADFDNDGDQDLAILTVSGGFVFANDGRGKFSLCSTMPECRNTFSITAADYDNDGMLDLYIGRYWPDASQRGALPLPVPYYDATNGGRNVLLRNAGDWNFIDVTSSVGLDVDNSRYTMAAAWEDYDNDGDQDLYVANDFGRNCLYVNDNGQFRNVAAPEGVEDTAAGMSVAWSDFDHDGLVDLYVGNMFSSAGNRIAYQRQYEDSFSKQAQSKLQRLARGNSLFRNQKSTSFHDVTQTMGASMGRWAWSSLFVDLNNDSWDDIVIANGNVTTQDTGDL